MTDEQQQHETVTTTTTQSNLHILLTVKELIFWGDAMQMYPSLEEASGGQEQYSIRSAWHLVMHKVDLTFWGDAIEKMQMYP